MGQGHHLQLQGRGQGGQRWLYFTLVPSPQLTKEEETFVFTAMQDFPVRNLQPATVTLYDYYETGEPPLQPQSRLAGAQLSHPLALTSFGFINGSSPGPPRPEPTSQRSLLSLQVTARMLPTALLAAQVGAEPGTAEGSPHFGTAADLASLLCPLRSSSPGVWGHRGMGR